MEFNHFDSQGQAIMVDVSAKQPTLRTAVAEAVVSMSPPLAERVINSGSAKGDVLGVARLAGIAAVKRTPELIPLSHPLAVHHVAVEFLPDTAAGRIAIRCTVRAFERTGVEMEAMTGASVAALTVYDMVKGADKSVAIAGIRLLFKEGGKSGTYRREEVP
ncbi:cyclic pyranopterin monophosphate synthase MoaC [Trichlorobacter ammonificans]|uniref:Cyclic pyranopterin monophosphate synthase n=1 Tax=Trichlorobacter ammonificans TaxID=2916410 RepID=A0ABN8HNV9_9BACT|nr:cyclic pyranopterin monophosphate synthase MoaC [Trichlorobacter ammonificans]CAH2032683.1 cyclic pyranopterin monophosphate synthase [Trichlorobacter ammonificans]